MRSRSFAGAIAVTLLSACIGVPGCSAAAPAGDPRTELRDATGTDWVIDVHPSFKTVSFALPKSRVGLPKAGSTADAVLDLLDRHKTAFGMKNPRAEWKLAGTTKGTEGTAHLRFRQETRGLPVFGSDWIASIDGRDRLIAMSGVYIPEVESVDVRAAQAVGQISAVVEADVRLRRPDLADAEVVIDVDPRTFIYAAKGIAPALALHATTEANGPAGGDASVYVLDARTGAILLHLSSIATEIARGHGASHYSPYDDVGAAKRTFPVSPDSSKPGFWALDSKSQSGVVIQTVSASGLFGSAPITGADDPPNAGAPPSDWQDPSTPRGAAVDAHASYAAVVDATDELYGRKSFDGQGAAVVVRTSDNSGGKANAFWRAKSVVRSWLDRLFGSCSGVFGIGEGDPVGVTWLGGSSGKNGRLLPFGASLDVVAHEFAHGISTCSWGGGIGGASSAVSEAMSDILAEFISGKIEGTTPFLIARDLAPGSYARNLSNPQDPRGRELGYHCASLDELDRCDEVHRASTIVSYAWYLMTFGGKHITSGQVVECPLSWQDSSKLWYEVETTELPAGPDFKAVANATLAVGKRMNLPLEPIACAWVAVKVLTAEEAKSDYDVTCPGPDAPAPDSSSGEGGALVRPGGRLVCPGTPSSNDE